MEEFRYPMTWRWRRKRCQQSAVFGSWIRLSRVICRTYRNRSPERPERAKEHRPAGTAVLFIAGAIALLVAATSFGHAEPPGADLSAGKEAFNRGDYETALKEWQPLAEAGNSIAQQNIGFMYYHGFGVAKNSRTALQWFRRAAEKGEGESQMMLGVIYGNGEGVEVDLTESLTWFTIAILNLKDEENRRRATENREAVARTMSQDEIETAIDRAYDWGVTHTRRGQDSSESRPFSSLDSESADIVKAEGETVASGDAEAAKVSESALPTTALPPEGAGVGQDKAGFYVQIASLESRSAADEEWRRQRERHKDILDGRDESVQAVTLADGRVFYRLQIGPFTKPGPARELCAALKEQRQDCLVVRR